jgi:hypothetical protein
MTKMYLAAAFFGCVVLAGCSDNNDNLIIDDSNEGISAAPVSGKLLLEEEILRLGDGFHLRTFPAENTERDTDLTCVIAKGQRNGVSALSVDCDF